MRNILTFQLNDYLALARQNDQPVGTRLLLQKAIINTNFLKTAAIFIYYD